MHILLIITTLLFSPPALASTVIQQQIPTAEKIGTSRLRYLMWDVYDATLYAPEGRWQAQKPYALKLDYLRRLKGNLIAERAITEMRQQGYENEENLKKWQNAMTAIFPNVQAGDSITGIRDTQGTTLFYLGEKMLGRIEDPAFSEQFFNIWLGEKTSEPTLRRQLLGGMD